MTEDVLCALPCVMLERDALRNQLNLPPLSGRQQFTQEDRQKGKEMGPTAMLDHNGNLTVRLEL